ncbi:hypothetical protein JP0092_07920 [Helicobacter pylori]|nr:hypothetical protein JP0092_07920 [Helicobacter pylori]
MRLPSSLLLSIGLGLGVVLGVGYGVKKIIDAKNANDEAKDLFKKAEELLEETKKRVESAESGCKNALMGLGKKKLHVRNHGMSMFVRHFNQLKGHQFFVKASDTQDLHKQVSVVQNFSEQLATPTLAILGVLSAKKWKKS